ncbi:MAG TPA: hypothetical protein VK157_09110 [Phycisphaerales bacterium]|nr:hypothetical protein [Phycisphaerales bacterium]
MYGRNDRIDAASVWVLGIWAGSLIMTGASAAIIFPETREMGAAVSNLLLPVDEHWKYIAGRVQNRIFLVCDWVQIFSASIVLALFIAAIVRKRAAQLARGLWIARIIATVFTLGTLAIYLAWLSPAMQADLKAFWAALDAKNLEAARVAQTSFDRYHPIASRFFSAMTIGVVALGIVTALGIGRRAPTTPPGA